MNNHIPHFDNPASCAAHPEPDLWFPAEKSGSRNWTRTPEAVKARTICQACPARQECLDYSLQYRYLYGIWAGLDWYERHEIQDRKKIKTTDWVNTFTFSFFHDRNAGYDE